MPANIDFGPPCNAYVVVPHTYSNNVVEKPANSLFLLLRRITIESVFQSLLENDRDLMAKSSATEKRIEVL